LLEALNELGSQVMDLEKLAMHKGSVLGDLPGEPQPAQKLFESRVWAALSGFNANRPVYVEAESKKVGSVRVPEALILQMRKSPCIEVKVSDALRVQLLREEYAHLIANKVLLFDKLDCLSALHPPAKILDWKALATSGKWDDFVADMLACHYDPAYLRSMFKNFVYAESATPLIVKDISAAHFSRLARSLPS
jgi:tRNA 2-selenouridine synthase